MDLQFASCTSCLAPITSEFVAFLQQRLPSLIMRNLQKSYSGEHYYQKKKKKTASSRVIDFKHEVQNGNCKFTKFSGAMIPKIFKKKIKNRNVIYGSLNFHIF